MLDHYDKAIAARDFVLSHLKVQPRIAIVLGSGLGSLTEEIHGAVSIDYRQIPYWPAGRVPGHRGEVVTGEIAGTAVAVLSGRAHLYEEFSAPEVAFSVRVLGLLRIRTLILTNASGAIHPDWPAGRLALLSDHINLQRASALIGEGSERFGPLFTDLSEPYDPEFRRLAHRAARALNLPLVQGVYAAVLGPNYETPAEIRHLRASGADMVGMSTVQETMAARQIGMRVLAISVLTNKAAGLGTNKLSHEEVLAAGKHASTDLIRLLREIVPQLPADLADAPS